MKINQQIATAVKRSQNQHSLMRESNSLLEKRQEATAPFLSGNLGEKSSHSLPLTLNRNVHQKETLFRNAAKSEVMRKDKLHFSGCWHTNQSSAKSNRVWLTETQHNQIYYCSVSQPLGRGPVPGPGINYTGPREVLLEVVTLVF